MAEWLIRATIHARSVRVFIPSMQQQVWYTNQCVRSELAHSPTHLCRCRHLWASINLRQVMVLRDRLIDRAYNTFIFASMNQFVYFSLHLFLFKSWNMSHCSAWALSGKHRALWQYMKSARVVLLMKRWMLLNFLLTLRRLERVLATWLHMENSDSRKIRPTPWRAYGLDDCRNNFIQFLMLTMD